MPNGVTAVYDHYSERDERWVQLQEKTMGWPDGRVVKYSIAVDISELKETQNRLAEAHAELALKNRELVRLSTTDMLTGLANRQHGEAVLSRELADCSGVGRSYCLIMLDIDHFKRINDRHGHQRGDVVLRALAGCLRRAVPEGLVVGRFGGEEFLVGCPDTRLADAYLLAEALRLEVWELELPDAGRITCSFGVAEARPGEGWDNLLARVDEALYTAKALGRNRVETA
jgi:diguanylate cyclase (GGDEF)-like protein